MQRVAALLLNVVLQDDGGLAVELKYRIANEIPQPLRERLRQFTKAVEEDVRNQVNEMLGAAREYVIKDKDD